MTTITTTMTTTRTTMMTLLFDTTTNLGLIKMDVLRVGKCFYSNNPSQAQQSTMVPSHLLMHGTREVKENIGNATISLQYIDVQTKQDVLVIE